MTDRELLELAAKAAGLKRFAYCELSDGSPALYVKDSADGNLGIWAPLTDDGDALRLAAKLHIDLDWQATCPIPDPHVEAYQRNESGASFCATQHEVDYRKAIVRVAAEIGRGMP